MCLLAAHNCRQRDESIYGRDLRKNTESVVGEMLGGKRIGHPLRSDNDPRIIDVAGRSTQLYHGGSGGGEGKIQKGTHSRVPVVLAVLFEFVQGRILGSEARSEGISDKLHSGHVLGRFEYRRRIHDALMEDRLRGNLVALEARLVSHDRTED